ncbi:MAG: transposase [Rhodobacterales bacterium]|nr:MAG: transposase [Rhodobacterales bacterium]
MDMPRTHGYALRGTRCFGVQNWNARGWVSAIGALLAGALLSVVLTTANVDVATFNLWLEHDLIPKLPAGAVLVMDNAAFHRRADTIEIIARAGHSLEYLPPYSPDLNPIKHKWAQAKARRRKTGATVEELFRNQF